MNNLFHYGEMPRAYERLLDCVYYSPEYTSSPRGQLIKECTNVQIIIDNPCVNLFTNAARQSTEKYISAEILWYFSGKNTIDFISKYAKMWDNIKNEDGTVNSAYGYLLFTEKNIHGLTQYQWAIDSLRKDKDSRQAIMHFNNTGHQYFGNKDQVCTMYGIFNIREDRLNFTIQMRSNDIVYGLMTDFAFFNILHQQAHRHLKYYYPNLQMGIYTHFTNSLHLYEKHFELVEKMLKHPCHHAQTPTLDCDYISEIGAPLCYPEDSEFHNYIMNNLK
jgi:thymidylate synthase